MTAQPLPEGVDLERLEARTKVASLNYGGWVGVYCEEMQAIIAELRALRLPGGGEEEHGPDSAGRSWPQMANAGTEPSAKLAAAVKMLARCQRQFAYYEDQHRAKKTPEADHKAEVNRLYARDCAEQIEFLTAPAVSAAPP